MRGFLLDTNFVSELVRIQPDPMVALWMAEADDTKLNLSVLTLGEIRRGIHDLPDSVRRRSLVSWLETELPARFAGRIIGIDTAIAEHWGILSSEMKRRGTPVGTVDLLLAATAFHHGSRSSRGMSRISRRREFHTSTRGVLACSIPF